MEIIVASDIQWGDEGKGKINYYLSQFTDVSMRCGGGSNAEATFYHNKKGFHFRMMPIGIMHNNVSILSDGVLIGCDHLINEIQQLEAVFGDISSRFMISGNAHVVLPSQRDKDAFLDEKVLKIKTIRQGVGPALADRAYRMGVNVDTFIASGGEPEGQSKHWDDRKLYVKMLTQFRQNTKHYLASLRKTDKKILIQGVQGFMLDNVHGSYPFVTSSYTSSTGLLQGAGLPFSQVSRNIGITKAYLTRYSVGVLPTECTESEQEYIRKAGNEFSHGTLVALRVGWLDLVALKYAQAINDYTELALTKIDVLSELKEIPVCVAYRYQGKTLDNHYEWSNMDASEYEPVYKVLKGWQCSIRGVQNFMDLPVEAQNYVMFIEEQLGVRVSMIGTGPLNEELIIR
ncbi:MAG: adenylosuccinate synthetase [Methylococcales bacterium]|nr:adenylosuccinate synthetase [Methylococcales bacterium]